MKSAYFNSSAHLLLNDNKIIESFQTSKQEILNKIAQWISEGSGWTIQSIDSHYINIVNYKPFERLILYSIT